MDLTGEYEDRNFVVTRGDSRLGMMIAKNKDTAMFNRESRFLIDDDDAKVKLSYCLTKPLKVGWLYNNEGVYKFVLTECNSEDSDNHELGIANYYNYYPKSLDNGTTGHNCSSSPLTPPTIIDESNSKKEVWI